MSRRELRFTADSRRDLRSIFRYTERRWGERQRDDIAEQLRESLQRLADFPDLGRPRNEIASDLRSWPVIDYVVYYRVSDAETTILRVVHHRRDLGERVW